MMKYLTTLIAALLLAAAVPDTAAAALEGTPDTIDYQGRVLDQNLKPLGIDGSGNANPTNYTAQFRIYDALTGGRLLWSESQLVTVTSGQFSVRLGLGSPIVSDSISTPLTLKQVFEGKTRYLGVSVLPIGATSAGEIAPRLAFLSSPFAISAERAKLADVATSAKSADTVFQQTGSSTFDTTIIKTATITTANVSQNVTVTGNVTAHQYTGIGTNLTQLNASNITIGTVPLAVMHPDIPKKSDLNDWGNKNNFSSPQNVFVGDGTGLTINATKITSGTLDSGRLGADVVRGALGDKPLFVRGFNDYHGLVFGNGTEQIRFNVPGHPDVTQSSGQWFNVDGPVVFGYSGGALATVNLVNNVVTAKKVMQWSSDAVYMNAELNFNRGTTGTWYLSQTKDFGGTGNGGELRVGMVANPNWFFFQNTGAFSWSSDLRLKKDITSIPPILDSLLKLRPVNYRFKTRPETESKLVGFIAQEVLPYFPDTVSTSGGMYGLSYSDFGVFAIRGLQELTAETRSKSAASDVEIKRLQAENASLHRDVDNLQRRLEALEQRLK